LITRTEHIGGGSYLKSGAPCTVKINTFNKIKVDNHTIDTFNSSN